MTEFKTLTFQQILQIKCGSKVKHVWATFQFTLLFIIMTFSTAQLREADLFVQSVLQTCSQNLTHMTIVYTALHFHPFPQLVLMALLPALGGGGLYAAIYSSGLIVPVLNSQPPCIHNLSLFPLLWPASIIAFGEHAGAADIVHPHGKH